MCTSKIFQLGKMSEVKGSPESLGFFLWAQFLQQIGNSGSRTTNSGNRKHTSGHILLWTHQPSDGANITTDIGLIEK